MPPTISTATAEEIQAALSPRNPQAREPKHCLRCHELFQPARHWQEFCKPKCRSQYHNGAWEREALRLAARVRALEAEISELRKEASAKSPEPPSP